MIETIIAVVLLIGISAFFSGSETALTAASRPRMHALASEGHHRATVVNNLHGRMEQVIGASLLGQVLVSTLASALATSALIATLGEHGVAYATVGMTVLLLLFGELLPKTYAINQSDRTALAVAPIMRIVVAATRPITHIAQLVVRGALRLAGARAIAD